MRAKSDHLSRFAVLPSIYTGLEPFYLYLNQHKKDLYLKQFNTSTDYWLLLACKPLLV